MSNYLEFLLKTVCVFLLNGRASHTVFHPKTRIKQHDLLVMNNNEIRKHVKRADVSEWVPKMAIDKIKNLFFLLFFLARGAFASQEEVLSGEKKSIIFNEMAGIWLCICLFVIIPVGLWNLAIVAKLRKLAKEKGKEKEFNEWILDPWKFNRSVTLKEECLFRNLDLALCIKYLQNGRICYFCLLCVVICFSVYYYARMI